MYCNKCGTYLPEDAVFCHKCGAHINKNGTPPVNRADNSNVFCILSYISILWLFGLLVTPEKDDPRVRFHVGQGIIASIVSLGCQIAVGILIGIFRIFIPLISTLLLSPILHLAASAVFVYYLVYGIVYASKGEDRELPIIGKYAFYK